ncbi:hypothetical protein LTR66_007859 [Elasticomyces elasticus]|nr:hypothetical protein LTR66_007859 [Elasticomyces elasticus]
MLEDGKEDHVPRRPPYRRRRWQIGMFLFLIANIVGSSIQITTLPLPVLSTLQASGLVFNALLASLLLHESFTVRTALGTLLVTVGAVLISLFSALPEPSHNLDQLLHLLTYPQFITWFVLSIALVLFILAATFFLQHCIPLHRRHNPKVRLLRGMSYGAISGVLSAHALLLAKSAVELLVRTIVDKSNQFNRYQSWLLLLSFLILALTQLYYLHRGLKLASTSVLYPFVFCVYNIIAILDGLIYFRQMSQLPVSHACLIALGTVILLSGVLALSWRLDDAKSSTGKAEIPQTALGPGMGFVDDTDTATNSADEDGSATLDEENSIGENSPLVRSKTEPVRRDSSLATGKRKRRDTIREVETIWDELHDSNYGTVRFQPSVDFKSRRSSGQVHNSAEDADDEAARPLADGRQRRRRSGSLRGRRRRRSTQLSWLGGRREDRQKSLLPQGWYRMDWWRKKRKESADDDPEAEDEDGSRAPRRPSSAG